MCPWSENGVAVQRVISMCHFESRTLSSPPLTLHIVLWKRIISGGHSPEACPCPGVTSPCTTDTPTRITPQKCIKCWKAKNCIRVHKSKQMLCPSTSLVWCFSPEIISLHRVPHTKHSRMLSSTFHWAVIRELLSLHVCSVTARVFMIWFIRKHVLVQKPSVFFTPNTNLVESFRVDKIYEKNDEA